MTVRDATGRFTPGPRPAGLDTRGAATRLLSALERENRSRAIKNAMSHASYGDPTFPGNGTIRCTICGEPCRDHKIGPCPRWVGR